LLIGTSMKSELGQTKVQRQQGI